jgi:hypothetical protein
VLCRVNESGAVQNRICSTYSSRTNHSPPAANISTFDSPHHLAAAPPRLNQFMCVRAGRGLLRTTLRTDFRTTETSSLPSRLTVSCLPIEILYCAFAFLAAERGYEPWETHTRDCYVFTHVCRAWRIIALAEPRLWSRLCYDPTLKCAKTMLARAGTCPLVLEVSGHQWGQYCRRNKPGNVRPGTHLLDVELPNTTKPFDFILDHLDRAGEIKTDCWPVDAHNRLDSLTGCRAPLLAKLELTGLGRFGQLESPSLGVDFLKGAVPGLQCLSIKGMLFFAWTDPILSNLRAISLGSSALRQTTASTSSISLHLFLAFLRRNPGLRDLDLHGAGVFPALDSGGSHLGKVELPQLASLSLSCVNGDLHQRPTVFLPYLVTPPTTCIDISTGYPLREAAAIRAVLDDVEHFLRTTHSAAPVLRVNMIWREHIVSFMGYVDECADKKPRVRISFAVSDQDHAETFANYFRLPTHDIRVLSLSATPTFPVPKPISWPLMLTRLPSLHTILLHGLVCVPFVYAFERVATDPAAFPALARLTLSGERWNTPERTSEEMIEAAALLFTLAVRADTGRALDFLRLDSPCPPPGQWVDEVDQVVIELEVVVGAQKLES